MFCNAWVEQDLIRSVLISTVPHVSTAARSKSFYVQKPLLHEGKAPVRTVICCRTRGSGINKLVVQNILQKFHLFYHLERKNVEICDVCFKEKLNIPLSSSSPSVSSGQRRCLEFPVEVSHCLQTWASNESKIYYGKYRFLLQAMSLR